MPRALFRCDASPAIGGGHMTRCLAIAETLADAGWDVAFAVGRDSIAMMPGILTRDFAVQVLRCDADDEPAALRANFPGEVDLLVVDHYQRDIYFEEACRGFARRILVLDDGTGRQHDCDFLLDAAASDDAVYRGGVPASARLLLGPAYALMRQSFVTKRAAALERREGRPVGNILVSFGATDPCNATSAALNALAGTVDDVAITVALSSRAPHLGDIRARSGGRVRLALDADMAELMTAADLAIGAAGASSYERAVLGLPSMVVTLTENQAGVARLLVEAGAAVDVGPLDATWAERLVRATQQLVGDSVVRDRMSRAAAALVDGRGSQRLLAALAGEVFTREGLRVRLRLAEGSDQDWLLDLQRAPPTRRFFRNPAVPGGEEHASWMSRTLADISALFLVIEGNGERAGYLRLKRSGNARESFEISIAVCPRLHGRGIGAAALSLARRLQAAAPFDAEVLPDNHASRSLFLKAGYNQVSETWYRQEPAWTPETALAK